MVKSILKSAKQYVTAFGKWGFLVTTLLVGDVVGTILSYYNNFGLPNWTWWLILVVILVISPLLAFHSLRVKRDELQVQLDDIKNARPTITFGIERKPEILRDVSTNAIIGTPVFAKLLVTNNPMSELDRVVALNVATHIAFIAENGRPIFHTMVGRWANTRHQYQGALPNEVAQMALHPNGLPEPLLIALKYANEELAYGLNVDNERMPGWRDPNKTIPVGTWKVKVHLKGINVEETILLILKNNGKGTDIELEREPASLIPDKEDSHKI